MTLGKPALDRRDRLAAALALVDARLFRLARQGLSRASPRTVVELSALSQTAHNAGMVRIERDLAALSTLVEHYVELDPNFHETRYLHRLCRLMSHVEKARAVVGRGTDPRFEKADLGEARRSYELAEAPLVAQAVGAEGWVTDSDFVGVTVHLRAGNRFLSLSSARPAAVFGNDPRRLFRQYPSDSVDVSIAGFSHGAHVFEHAKVAPDGRLSVHSELVVHAAPYSGQAHDGLVVERWSDAVEVVRAQLEPDDEVASGWVILRAANWSPVAVDDVASRASLVLSDRVGAEVHVRLPLRPENNALIDNLQTLARRPDLRPDGVFGRLTATTAGWRFRPMTGHYDAPVTLSGRRRETVNEVHLGLEDVERVQR